MTVVGVVGYRQFTRISFCYLVAPIFRGEFRLIKVGRKNSLKCKLPREFALEKWGHFMASNMLKKIVLVAQPISTDGGPPAWGQ